MGCLQSLAQKHRIKYQKISNKDLTTILIPASPRRLLCNYRQSFSCISSPWWLWQLLWWEEQWQSIRNMWRKYINPLLLNILTSLIHIAAQRSSKIPKASNCPIFKCNKTRMCWKMFRWILWGPPSMHKTIRKKSIVWHNWKLGWWSWKNILKNLALSCCDLLCCFLLLIHLLGSLQICSNLRHLDN